MSHSNQSYSPFGRDSTKTGTFQILTTQAATIAVTVCLAGSPEQLQLAAESRAARAEADSQLAEVIADIQDPTKGGDRTYGMPRVTAELNDGKDAVNG